MSGILGNFFKPENMDRLALGFNQLRMRPDAGLATTIQNRQALRQQQMGRDAAMEFFQGKFWQLLSPIKLQKKWKCEFLT